MLVLDGDEQRPRGLGRAGRGRAGPGRGVVVAVTMTTGT